MIHNILDLGPSCHSTTNPSWCLQWNLGFCLVKDISKNGGDPLCRYPRHSHFAYWCNHSLCITQWPSKVTRCLSGPQCLYKRLLASFHLLQYKRINKKDPVYQHQHCRIWLGPSLGSSHDGRKPATTLYFAPHRLHHRRRDNHCIDVVPTMVL